jgi:hypothetical protein
MKRSEINKALKELEKMIISIIFRNLQISLRKNGKQKAMSLMKSVIICLDGILPTTAWEILINMDFPCLLFVMEILK